MFKRNIEVLKEFLCSLAVFQNKFIGGKHLSFKEIKENEKFIVTIE
ncbi:hypothetical protein [Aliarcobacter butzleri]